MIQLHLTLVVNHLYTLNPFETPQFVTATSEKCYKRASATKKAVPLLQKRILLEIYDSNNLMTASLKPKHFIFVEVQCGLIIKSFL